ncbi:hypothetical protein PR1_38 [Providencia phage vB_PreS_PR1]|uniref:Uncharacterized protein n=1 Tax=Providencia phage vB_PreS_PR1 TaxID=1931407 RepID=A0A1S6KV84_9CAUD|nr:hypothetical protein FDH30_gp039 [Providencia phage vB_PreS_PR1]AQT25353.1 hypothetical protein PR1_38 [Providencia phage vB_PreS_PR1]
MAFLFWFAVTILVLGSKANASRKKEGNSSWLEVYWRFSFEIAGERIDSFTKKIKNLTKEK